MQREEGRRADAPDSSRDGAARRWDGAGAVHSRAVDAPASVPRAGDPVGPPPPPPQPQAAPTAAPRPSEPVRSEPARPPPPGIDPNVGDWLCAGPCGNWNWAKRHACNRCGASRPLQLGPPPATRPPDRCVTGGFGSGSGSYASSEKLHRACSSQVHDDFGYIVPKDVRLAPGAEGRVVAIQAKAGWEMKPKGTAGTGKRTGSAGGFMEFDREAEDDRRKRRAVEERQEKDFRKAEKIKCSFCRRFSCIC